MFRKTIGFAAAVLCTSTLAQSQAERETYADFTTKADLWGLTWEPIKVKTEDGWTLTMFRLTGD